MLSDKMRAAIDFYSAIGVRLPETPRWGAEEWDELTKHSRVLPSTNPDKVKPRDAQTSGASTGSASPVQPQFSKPRSPIDVSFDI